MKIAKFITSKYAFPYPAGKVFAPYDVADVLTRSLIQNGHEVTWFAPKGTQTPARLIDCGIAPTAENVDWNDMPPSMRQEMNIWADGVFLSHIAERADEFDIIHVDSFLLALPFARVIKHKPIVLTLHNPLNVPNIRVNFEAHKDLQNLFFIAVSESQKQPLLEANWIATIHHGLDIETYQWSAEKSDRWIFASRILPSKGAHIAARLAKQAGEKLDIIGPVYPNDQEYFDKEIAPFVDGEQIRYLGPKAHTEMPQYFAKAKGFLFPVQGDEAFGLVVIEALAAGTPVIASRRASMPELIIPGQNGFLADSDEEILHAMSSIDSIDRTACRRDAEERFSMARVTREYEQTFQKILQEFPSK